LQEAQALQALMVWTGLTVLMVLRLPQMAGMRQTASLEQMAALVRLGSPG
jgi:hypothetical protein